MTLTEFLLARVDEDELEIGPPSWCDCYGLELSPRHGVRCPVRMLAECATKRGLIADAGDVPTISMRRALRWLAQPYADHADFDPAWATGA